MPKQQGQLGAKLSSLRPQIKTRVAPEKKVHEKGGDFGHRLPPVQNWSRDGEDHINLWEEGEVELGRILSHRYELEFDHTQLGRFKTMEALDRYVMSRDRDDRIRNLTGPALKKFAKNLVLAPVINFRAIVMDANWQRIKQYPDLATAVKESTLPFDVYYIIRDSGVRVRPARASWFLAGYEELRRALKEDREPNFDFLKDNKDAGTYEFIHRKAAPVKKAAPVAQKSGAGKKVLNKKPPALESSKGNPDDRQALRKDLKTLEVQALATAVAGTAEALVAATGELSQLNASTVVEPVAEAPAAEAPEAAALTQPVAETVQES
jgi:hypothetical protein